MASGDHAPLPVPFTALVGRTREIAGIAALLGRDDVRLVTLTGPGGVGKTRAAIAAAREIAVRFRHGARFVTLAPVSGAHLVAAAIAQALGVQEAGDIPVEQRLVAFLRDKHLLLVLDNFEHVVDASPLVARLLASCPDLRVLATSRIPLKLSGEREYALAPLGVADPAEPASPGETVHSDAVLLFAERARAVAPDFQLSADMAPLISEICRRLDGLPLAIELAAARVKVLPPSALLARLEHRLPLLTGGNRDLPDRQRTMRDAIAWSYDLLSPEDQVLFRCLSVFVGGFTLEAAEAVSRETENGKRQGEGQSSAFRLPSPVPVLDGITSLVDKSLVRPEASPGDQPRYGMLETIREFGLEQLAKAAEEDDVRRAHAAWCLDLAERARERSLSGRRWSIPTVEPDSLRLVEADHDNIRSALTWLELSGDWVGVLRLAGAMWGFWFLRGHRRESRAWLERALDATRDDGVPREARARALIGAGLLARNQGAYERANTLANEYLSIALESGEPWREDEARWLLGYVALAQGAYEEATAQLERALSFFDPASDLADLADGRSMLGMAAYGTGDLARAAALQENALATFQRVDDPYRSGLSLGYLGMIACDRGDHRESAARYADALSILRAIGGRETLAEWFAGVAALASARAAWIPAARLAGAAEALRAQLGHVFTLPERSAYERGAGAAAAALGEAAFAATLAAGGAVPPEQAVTEAADFLDSVIASPEPARAPDAGIASGLTPREAEVVRLVAAGMSNAEIADALFVSVPTVKRHLTNILGKLELPSRSALNTWAHAHGLA